MYVVLIWELLRMQIRLFFNSFIAVNTQLYRRLLVVEYVLRIT